VLEQQQYQHKGANNGEEEVDTEGSVCGLRSAVQETEREKGSQVLFDEMQKQGTEEAVGQRVRAVRESVSSWKSSTGCVLQEVCDEVGCQDSEHIEKRSSENIQGVRLDLESRTSVSVGEQGVCSGASPRDGASDGKDSQDKRSSASQKWSKGRQPPGESRIAVTDGARKSAEADIHGDVPVLPNGLSNKRECPHCGSELIERPAVGHARVLDPFSGTGTTGQTACFLGHDYVGIELNPEYAAHSEEWIAKTPRWHLRKTGQKPVKKRKHREFLPLFD
jgi:hypothetical protein